MSFSGISVFFLGVVWFHSAGADKNQGTLAEFLNDKKPGISLPLGLIDNKPSSLSGLLGGNRPGKKPGIVVGGNLIKPGAGMETSLATSIGPGEEDDGCKREYPLTSKNPQQVPYAFNRYAISPILTKPPADFLEVEYDDLRSCQPNLGNEVNVCGVNKAPSRIKWKCARDKFYSLFLIDLCPLGPANPELLAHGILWWVVDIPSCDVAKGLVLYAYQQPLPFYGSGKNKYAFLVYEQPQYEIDWSEESRVTATSESYRYYKCLHKLVNKYELILVAGNFFCAEFQPCIKDVRDNLDDPEPQYITKAEKKARLPRDPSDD